MSTSVEIWIFVGSVFFAVSALASVLGVYVERRRRIVSRLSGNISVVLGAGGGGAPRLPGRVLSEFDDRLGSLLVDEKTRTRLRMELVRAGYFSPDAPKMFVMLQAFSTLVAGLVGYLSLTMLLSGAGIMIQILCMITALYGGYLLPDAYIKWRRSKIALQYKQMFPDFLDLLVVCVNAGLSLNAALDRVSADFIAQCKPLATNLSVLMSEMRAGRSTAEALDNLCDRLGIDEARSFATLIKQSLELGSDISDAMTVYSDEMRSKRLLRAEELANALPVKLLLPLGFFIFPVILIVVLTPTLIRVFAAFREVMGA